MRKYFIFRIKDSLKVIILFSVIALICSYVSSFEGYIRYSAYQLGEQQEYPISNPIEIMSFIGLGLSIIVPIFEFNYRMKKISIDQMYSLPIKREKIFITHYLIGLIKIIIPLLVSFIFYVIDLALEPDVFTKKYIYLFFLALILSVILIYTFVTFCFMRGNTLADGIINILFGIFFFATLFTLFENGTKSNVIQGFNTGRAYIFNPLFTFNDYFVTQSEWWAYRKIQPQSLNLPVYKEEDVWWLVFSITLCIASFIGSIILVKKEKSEDAMGISTSWFSYKTMIPFYIFFFSFISIDVTFIIYILILLAGFILYVIYRRNIKIKLVDVCILIGSVFLGILFGNILQ